MRTGIYTKTLVAFIALPLSLYIVVSSAAAQGNGAKKTVTEAVPSLDEEARNVARLYWRSMFTKCGASFYTYAGDEYHLDAQGQLHQSKWPPDNEADPPVPQTGMLRQAITFEEYKGALFGVFTVTHKSISPSDQLNGLEWTGYVEANPHAVWRQRNIVDVNMGWDPWSSWHDVSSLGVDLRKIHGKWFVLRGYNIEGRSMTDLKPTIESCSVKSRFLPIE